MTTFADVDFWTAGDGARMALRCEHARGTRRGVLIFVHGWGDHGGLFGAFAARMAGTGLDVFALDQRGAGLSPGPRGHIERFSQYVADLAALRRHLQKVAPGPQVVLGHSYGGFVVLRYVETAPADLAGAVAVSPFVDFYAAPPRWKVKLASLLSDLAPRLGIPTGLDLELRTRNSAMNRELYDDPLCHHLMTPRAYQETMATLPILLAEKARIGAPLLVLLAGDDRIVSTPAARAFAHGLAGDVTVAELEGMYHDLFHEDDADRAYAQIDPWLARVLPAA